MDAFKQAEQWAKQINKMLELLDQLPDEQRTIIKDGVRATVSMITCKHQEVDG